MTLTTEKMRFLGVPGADKTSVIDWPAVNDACKSAVPLIFTTAVAPDFPGTHGTCFGVRLARGVVFVTAGHVMGGVDQSKVEVPIAFGENQRSVVRIAHLHSPTPSASQYQDACDFAVMVPMDQPPTNGHFFRPVDINVIANVENMCAPQLYAVAGYPREHPTGNLVNYEQKKFDFQLCHFVGNYKSKAVGLPGCHTLELSTALVGGAQGLSGSPVFRVLFDKENTVSCSLAGMVIRGNANLVHFIGVDCIASMLLNEQAVFFE